MRIIGLSVLAIAPVLGELKLEPTLHLQGVVGATTADSPEDLAVHGHDPNNNFALQGFDLGLNLHYGENWAGFVNMNAFTEPNHDLEAEWEEGFLKYTGLFGGLEVRGGRFLNRLGLQNNRHLHAWSFVDANLSTGSFLGEDGLRSEGVELTWLQEFDSSFLAVTGSFGGAVNEEHDHGDEDEEHGDEGEEHGHGGESELAFFDDELTTARIFYGYNHTDFHQHRFGLNGAWGGNGYGQDTTIYSVDYSYTWRENGLESGGREFSTGLEYFYRETGWQHEDEADHRGETSQAGLMAFARYRFSDDWVGDLRYGWIEGKEAGGEMEMGETEYAFVAEERKRLSLALTREFDLYEDTNSQVRLQYNYDDLDSGSENSIWLQFGFNFGPGEVR